MSQVSQQGQGARCTLPDGTSPCGVPFTFRPGVRVMCVAQYTMHLKLSMLPKLATTYTTYRDDLLAVRAPRNASGRISARQGHLLAACRLHRRCSGSAAALCNRINFALALLLLLVLEVSDSQHAILHVGRLPSSLLLLGDPKGQWQSETISGNQRQSEAISPGTPRGSERPVAI